MKNRLSARPAFSCLWALCLVVLLASSALSAEIKDSESASHGDEAATYQVVDVYNYPGFELVQFNLAVLSHYSYMLMSEGKALVVDPGRDVGAYLDYAEKAGADIIGVFLTHSHADFVAGHMELANASGCPIFAGAASGAEYPHTPIKEGSVIEVGKARVKILETPGHTPDGLCGLVSAEGDEAEPLALLSGDTLFIGSVGRPDLMGGAISAAALASMMYDTWTQKLSKLPDSVALFPAHGAGSLCGAHLSDDPTSTLGEQKTSNPYLAHKGRGEFVAAVLDGLPDAPAYFKHDAALNKQGPPLVDWGAIPERAEISGKLSNPAAHYVVDLRDQKAYASGHVPGSVNIGLRGRLESWVGTMAPWFSDLVLVGSPEELSEAIYRLHRVGYSGAVVAFDDYEAAGLPVALSGLVAPRELFDQMDRGEAPVVVDVRLPAEWMALRIGTVVNLPLNRLSQLSSKLDPALPVVTVCNSAYRSSMAVGVLERNGFDKLASLEGGSQAWIDAGLPVYGADAPGHGAASMASAATQPERAATQPAQPRAQARQIRLPERISAGELSRLIKDLPGTFQLIDIRPAEAYADYHLPGSANVDIADAMNNPAWLTGAGPLILVDRDGSLAMAVGGILSQKTKRPIKVLYGGLTAWWEETELGGAVKAMPLSPAPATEGAPALVPAAPAAPPAAPTPPPPAKPKQKSAGC